MPRKPKVAIGLPAYGPQHISLSVVLSAYQEKVRDIAKFGGLIAEGVSNTDINRNKIAKRFLDTDADYLYWWDADNIPPVDALHRLLPLAEEDPKVISSGLYYGGDMIKGLSAVAYLQNDTNGAYHTISDVMHWERGEILSVHAVGLGACLMHRRVFEEVEDAFEPAMLMGGGLITIPKSAMRGELPDYHTKNAYTYKFRKGHYYMPLAKPTADMAKLWPYFQCLWNRTEDFVFFEMAREVGYKIKIDTSVEVGHLKPRNYEGVDFREQKGLTYSAEVIDASA